MSSDPLTSAPATFLQPDVNTFINHILNPVIPECIPVEVAQRGHRNPDDALIVLRPGVETSYLFRPGGTVEIAVVVHAVVDRDYDGQYAYLQVARRPHDQVPFSEWHYGFFYRGGRDGVTWDFWQLDCNFGQRHPSYSEFGAYVDQND